MLILQFVINMLLLNVEMPSESRSLLVQISDLANFDVLSKLDSTTYIFGSYAFNPEIRKPFKPIYQDLYPSMNLIENLGTSFYLTVLCFVAKLVTLYLNLIQKLIKRRIKALDWLKKSWSSYCLGNFSSAYFCKPISDFFSVHFLTSPPLC